MLRALLVLRSAPSVCILGSVSPLSPCEKSLQTINGVLQGPIRWFLPGLVHNFDLHARSRENESIGAHIMESRDIMIGEWNWDPEPQFRLLNRVGSK